MVTLEIRTEEILGWGQLWDILKLRWWCSIHLYLSSRRWRYWVDLDWKAGIETDWVVISREVRVTLSNEATGKTHLLCFSPQWKVESTEVNMRTEHTETEKRRFRVTFSLRAELLDRITYICFLQFLSSSSSLS